MDVLFIIIMMMYAALTMIWRALLALLSLTSLASQAGKDVTCARYLQLI